MRTLSDVSPSPRYSTRALFPERSVSSTRAGLGAFPCALADLGMTRDQFWATEAALNDGLADAIMEIYPTIWDPTLRDHLLECLAPRKLAKDLKLRIARWMLALWPRTPEDDLRWRMGDCLIRLVVPEIREELLGLLAQRRWGASRILLCEAVAVSGDPRAAQALAGVLDDKSIAVNAIAMLGKLKAATYAPRIRPFLRHAEGDLRREARKALARMGEPVETPLPPVHLFNGRREKALEEWSTNLDVDELLPFLQKLSALIDSGFGKKEVSEVVGVAEMMRVEQTKNFRFPIRYRRESCNLFVSVFMDDVDSPDLYVFSIKPLIDAFAAAAS